MALPIALPQGYVLIYGEGTQTGISGIVPNNSNIRFGEIYQVWAGGQTFVYEGTSVMFEEKNVLCRLAWNNWPYTMIEGAKLAGTEEAPPP